ncbi:MAG: SulP family inorganic anion transporter [Mycoplasmatales bacterium]
MKLRSQEILTKEILSGIVIAIALIPEAIAFSFVLGVNPMVGLYTSVIIGFITAIFGGRPGMISAATGSVAAVFAPLVKNYGIDYLIIAVILMGIFQIIFGLLNIGKLFRLISKPIMLGFVNGLAIVILMAQLEQFKVPGTEIWLSGIDMLIMLSLTSFTFLMVVIIPKYIKAVPATLIAIIITTIIALFLQQFNFNIYTVKDMTLAGKAAVTSSLPPLNNETLKIILIPSLSAALVGLVESLLTLNLLDELTNTRGHTKKEAIAQGLANIVTGLFGGMGGCAMIGQSMINYTNGARKYLSTFCAALFLLFFISIGKNIISIIPLASLVGVMMVVVYKTFAWDSLVLYKKSSKFDIFIIILVAGVTVITGNLALGVLLGVLCSMAKFTWSKTTNLNFVKTANQEQDILILQINGILFFGSEKIFKDEVKAIEDEMIKEKIKNLELDLQNAKIVDYSAANAVIEQVLKLREKNLNIDLKNLTEDSKNKLIRINALLLK